ncbi:MAG: hypothetical protein ACTSO7_10065 [Candidatus Heimdallarchaeota archaeon]
MAKKGLKFPRKLQDALTIFSILALINYIIILIIFVQLPVARTINIDEETDTIYYWDGYTIITDLTNSSNVQEDHTTDLPHGGSNLILSSLSILMVVNLVQIIVALFAKKMKRKTFINSFIWPQFIGNGLLLAGAIPFIWWSMKTRTDDIQTSISSSIMYAFSLAIIVLLLVFVAGSYTSILYLKKKEEPVN